MAEEKRTVTLRFTKTRKDKNANSEVYFDIESRAVSDQGTSRESFACADFKNALQAFINRLDD